jgi:rhomboid protease GluP
MVAAIVAVSLLATVVERTGEVSLLDLGAVLVPFGDEWWRVAATPFLHDNLGYQFVALTATAIFGTHLERRFGLLVPLVVFAAAGAGGAALAAVTEFPAIGEDSGVRLVLGANGAALGLLCAWLVDDRLARRRGDDRGNDMIGVLVIAAVLALLSAAEPDANLAAAAGGAGVGAALGLVMSSFRR